MRREDIILIVDDDPDHLYLMDHYVSSYGYQYKCVERGTEAIEHLQAGNVSVVVTDMVMPEMDGMELLKYTKKYYADIDVVVMTGYSSEYSYIDVIQAGATDFIKKPFKRYEFLAKLDRVFRERHLLRELRQAKEKAEAASTAKTNFMNLISHELKTPMNGILGFTQLLRNSDLPQNQREYVNMISESAGVLMNLINHLLDFSRIDAQKNDLKPSHFNLPKLFEEIFCSIEPKANAKGLPLKLVLEDSLSQKILFGDSAVLSQVLIDIIDNAVKFSDQGEIVIDVVSKEQLEAERLLIQFSISDHGCGMEQDKIASLFEPFIQAENYLTRKHGGAGLGLAICSNLVQLMNGDIWVESQLGEGSTFHFTADMKLA